MGDLSGGETPWQQGCVQKEMLTGQAPHPTPASGFAWAGFRISLSLPLGLNFFHGSPPKSLKFCSHSKAGNFTLNLREYRDGRAQGSLETRS